MKNCTLYYSLGEKELGVAELTGKCRYHKCKENFPSTAISPDGLCPAAFNVLYPHCLSMLSRGKYPKEGNKDVCKIKCPGKPGRVQFNIFRKSFKRRGIEKLKLYFKKFVDLFIPVGLLERRVFIEVVKVDSCPFNYEQGREFEVNIGDKKEICPAAFYSLYPFYLSFIDKAKNSNCLVPCPDYNANIVFQLDCGNKGGENLNKFYSTDCDSYNDIYVRTGKGEEYSINELLGYMGIPCYSLFYNSFPYIETLEKDGSLGFLTFDRDAAGIQCPNLDVQTKAFIKRDKKKNAYLINVFGSKGKCPKGIRKGQSYELPDFSNSKFDITVLANIFPYVTYLKYLLNFRKDLDKKFEFSYSDNSSHMEAQIYRKAGAGALQ